MFYDEEIFWANSKKEENKNMFYIHEYEAIIILHR